MKIIVTSKHQVHDKPIKVEVSVYENSEPVDKKTARKELYNYHRNIHKFMQRNCSGYEPLGISIKILD